MGGGSFAKCRAGFDYHLVLGGPFDFGLALP